MLVTFSDFEFTGETGNCLSKIYHGQVTKTVTSGSLWWKKTETTLIEVCREVTSLHWFYADSGDKILGQAEVSLDAAVRAYKAKFGGEF